VTTPTAGRSEGDSSSIDRVVLVGDGIAFQALKALKNSGMQERLTGKKEFEKELEKGWMTQAAGHVTASAQIWTALNSAKARRVFLPTKFAPP
jgi:hypothetical protein